MPCLMPIRVNTQYELKFSFSEKATKIGAIFLMVLTFTAELYSCIVSMAKMKSVSEITIFGLKMMGKSGL